MLRPFSSSSSSGPSSSLFRGSLKRCSPPNALVGPCLLTPRFADWFRASNAEGDQLHCLALALRPASLWVSVPSPAQHVSHSSDSLFSPHSGAHCRQGQLKYYMVHPFVGPLRKVFPPA